MIGIGKIADLKYHLDGRRVISQHPQILAPGIGPGT